MMMMMLSVVNIRGMQDIWMEGREEVSHDLTWIPSFAGNFCFTSVCVYTNRNDFPLRVFQLVLTQNFLHHQRVSHF